MSRPEGSAVAASSTSICRPRYSSLRPCERAEAKNRTLVAGKSRSSSSARITWPTCPVAPTTPMLTNCLSRHFARPGLTSGSRVHHCLFLATEAERVVQRGHGLVQLGVPDEHRDPDLRGGDQVDVHPDL